MPKQVLILIGQPGSGKGTQAGLLAEKFSLYYFETSKILEDVFKNSSPDDFLEISGKKYFLAKEKELWEKGVLCSPPLVSYLVQQKISELHEQGKSLLLAGSPRTLLEGEELLPFLERLYGKENIRVVFLKISAEQTIFRNSHRRICELMRHPILYSKETEALERCPFDGSRLLKREGLDDPESIKVRLKEFENRTVPLINFLEKRGYQIHSVDGEGSVSEVFTRVLKALGE